MKRFSKLIGFIVVFIAVIAAFCTVSFAADSQYTANLIPTMTSDTSPSGIAGASGNRTDAFSAAWKAFNKNIYYYDASGYNAWVSSGSSGWLAYEFNTPQIITKYTIIGDMSGCVTPTVYNKMAPKNWTFEGWDGGQWAVLDTQTNITTWSDNVKKEFTFSNTTAYKKYRINISADNGDPYLIIGELEMMGPTTPAIQAPSNLVAVSGNAKINLSWDAVSNATSYNVKRTTTVGGPYTTIANGITTTTYSDTTAINGTTYYYVVSAVASGTEGPNTSEVTAKPMNPDITLEVTTVDKAKVGDIVTANIVIHNATNICAEDIKISYDTSRLEFLSGDGANGIKVYKEDSTESGVKRYITASLGKENAANGDKILLTLTFKAKAIGEAKIDILTGRIADNATLEMDVDNENCGEKVILIEGIKDVNRTGEFTLLDLGIDAWYFGDLATNTDTSKYDTDVVENSVIDDSDLAEIVNQMLKNTNYPNSTGV